MSVIAKPDEGRVPGSISCNLFIPDEDDRFLSPSSEGEQPYLYLDAAEVACAFAGQEPEEAGYNVDLYELIRNSFAYTRNSSGLHEFNRGQTAAWLRHMADRLESEAAQ